MMFGQHEDAGSRPRSDKRDSRCMATARSRGLDGKVPGGSVVERAMAGDADAFATLMRREVPRMVRVAGIMLRNEQWAQDAVQQAMVRAWRDLPGLRDPDRFDAWFRRVVINSCYDEARRQRRHRTAGTENAPEVALHDRFADVVERDRLDHAFRRLPIDQRAVLVLHHYLQVSQAEIAEMLGIAVGTVKSRLGRGLEALRASLAVDDAIDRATGSGEVTS